MVARSDVQVAAPHHQPWASEADMQFRKVADHDAEASLLFAAVNGHAQTVKLLLSRGTNIKAKPRVEVNIMHQVLRGLELRWSTAISQRSSVGSRTEQNYIDTIEVLHSSTPTLLYRPNRKGQTILHRAAALPGRRMVPFLIGCGMDTYVRDIDNLSLLEYALSDAHAQAHSAVTMLKGLLALGLAPLLQSVSSQLKFLESASAKRRHAVVQYLLRNHIPSSMLLYSNAVSIAAAHNRIETVQVLLDHFVPVNGSPQDSITSLGHLISASKIPFAMLELLLSRGADVNALGTSRQPCLTIAVQRSPSAPDYSSAIKRLLDAGAHPNTPDPQDTHPLTHLLNHDASLQQPDRSQSTSLELYNAALYLIQAGADVKATDTSTGDSLLHIAARKCNIEIFNLLRRNGSNVHALNDNGETVLHHAARAFKHQNLRCTSRRLHLVRVISKLGVHLRQRDRRGNDVVYYILSDALGNVLRESDVQYIDALLAMYVYEEGQGVELRRISRRLTRLSANKTLGGVLGKYIGVGHADVDWTSGR